jgi:hypothetical protein
LILNSKIWFLNFGAFVNLVVSGAIQYSLSF